MVSQLQDIVADLQKVRASSESRESFSAQASERSRLDRAAVTMNRYRVEGNVNSPGDPDHRPISPESHEQRQRSRVLCCESVKQRTCWQYKALSELTMARNGLENAVYVLCMSLSFIMFMCAVGFTFLEANGTLRNMYYFEEHSPCPPRPEPRQR